MAKCKQCGQDYEAKRSTSAYCSPKCKQEFYRNRMKPVTVTGVTVSDDKPVTVTGAKQGYIGAVPEVPDVTVVKPKRGKDIKCFADLPPDVQLTIDEISDTPEEKARRTQAAIRYQWLFPNRFYGTGPWATSVVTGKPGDADYNGICTPEWRAARGR